jgi:hypothetical protein
MVETEMKGNDSLTYAIVHHKNPYSLQGFKPGTSGFVVWTSDHWTYFFMFIYNFMNVFFIF